MTRSKLISVAREQLGYEHGEKFWRYMGFSSYVAWCACFVAWCANEADMLDYVPKVAECNSAVSWYKNKSMWEYSKAYNGSYTPQAGDIIYFTGTYSNNNATHTGIVTGISDGTVHTIEGNTSDRVAERTYQESSPYIMGYGKTDESSASGDGSGDSLQVLSDVVITYKDYVVKSGDTLASIAKAYNTSPAMIIYVNELTSGGLFVGETIKVPEQTNRDSSSGTLASQQKVTPYHAFSYSLSYPYARVQIYSETGLLSFTQDLLIKDSWADARVLSIVTNRDIGQDCPTFSIVLPDVDNYLQKINPNDLIIITLVRPPEDEHPAIYGLVDDVRRSISYNLSYPVSQEPIKSITITGRGFCKAFINLGIGAITELSVATKTNGFMPNQLDMFSNATPAKIISYVIDHYVDKGCNYHFTEGYFKDYFQRSIKEGDRNEFLSDTSSFFTYQGNLWYYLKELKDEPFNELFWDIIRQKPTLVFRPTPFDEDAWVNLMRITIPDDALVSENLGKSDLETYTLYKVNTQTFGGETSDLGYFPLWYPAYYHKYGISRLEVESAFLSAGEGDDEGQKSLVLNKSIKLFNWNIKNNAMLNGSITVRGSSAYHVGYRVLLESTNMEFYVEGVQHNFTLYNGWTTTLNVTRGCEPQLRFTAPYGCWEQLTPANMSDIYGYDVNAVEAEASSSSGSKTRYTKDLVFFTRYESGEDGYAQTGGDNGCAYGMYQFDYRYSLQPFLNYCYSQDSTKYAKFKPYLSCSTSSLQGNSGLSSAWSSIYNAYPNDFADMQDKYAYENYCKPCLTQLKNNGVDLFSRPDVIQGVIFSGAIQHGTGTFADLVIDCGVTALSTDTDIINRVYSARIYRYPRFTQRYTSEKEDALSRLHKE